MTDFNPDRRWLLPLKDIQFAPTKSANSQIRNNLSNAGIKTVLDLVACTLKQLGAAGAGKAARANISRFLYKKFGLTVDMISSEDATAIHKALDPENVGLTKDEIAHWLHATWPAGAPALPSTGNSLLALLDQKQFEALKTETTIDIHPTVIDGIKSGVLDIDAEHVGATAIPELHAAYATLQGRGEAPRTLLVVRRFTLAPTEIVAMMTMDAEAFDTFAKIPGAGFIPFVANHGKTISTAIRDGANEAQGRLSQIPAIRNMAIITDAKVLNTIPRPAPKVIIGSSVQPS